MWLPRAPYFDRYAAVSKPYQGKRKAMTGMPAYCGLICQTCPLYLATRQENTEEKIRMRSRIVELCKEHYGINYKLEDITDCDGCRTEGGRLFSASMNCPIRKCAREKGLENCAYCTNYVCELLEAFFSSDPAAKTRLDEIKRGIT